MADKYEGQADTHVVAFGKDPVKSLTKNFLRNITDREKSFAEMNYQDLLNLIKSKGHPGKDIRYVRAQLNEHARYLRSKGSDKIAKQAELYAQKLPTAKNDREGRDSKRKRIYDIDAHYQVEKALLKEHWPDSADFIYKRLQESGILVQIRERGLTLDGVMNHFELFPGERSGKLYVVHNQVMSEVEDDYGKSISNPEKFFESERYKDFPHIRLDDITLVLPRDVASKPTRGVERANGFHIVPKKEVGRFIDDLVRAN